MDEPARSWVLSLAAIASSTWLCGCPDAVRADGGGQVGGAGAQGGTASTASGGGLGGEGNTGNVGGAGGAQADRAIDWSSSCAFADDADSNEVDFGGTFTVELWFQPKGNLGDGEGQILVFNGGSAAGLYGYSIETAGNAVGFCGADAESGAACAWYSDVLEENVLYHIAGVYGPNGNGTVFVLNTNTPSPTHEAGTSVPLPMPTAASENVQRFAIGGRPKDPGRGCELDYRARGTIDDVRVRSAALQGGELDDELEAGLSCTPVDLRAFWRFEETESNSSVDCSENLIELLPQTFEGDGWQRVESPFPRRVGQ